MNKHIQARIGEHVNIFINTNIGIVDDHAEWNRAIDMYCDSIDAFYDAMGDDSDIYFCKKLREMLNRVKQ